MDDLDIIFSIGLILFNIYCFFLVGVESPAPTLTELGAAFWPRIIIVLMVILLLINVGKQIKSGNHKNCEKINIGEFFKGKLFIGMVLIIFMATSMPYIGFVTGCFIFLAAYGILLGERNIIKLLLNSLIITLILYILFQGLLDIRLERGIGIFRSLALGFEGILLNIRRGL